MTDDSPHPAGTGGMDVAAFDALPGDEATGLLHPICASPQWAAALVDSRPVHTLAAMITLSDEVIAGLPWSEVGAALEAHPRIGDRPAGTDRESTFSRDEQSAAVGSAEVGASLIAANVAYEQRFGHVFLVCATGLSTQDVLNRANARLGNDEHDEREVVRTELAAIVRLRLAKTLDGEG